MPRIFLRLAVANGTLLLITFLLGLFSLGEPRGPHRPWYAAHFLVALLALVATLMVHSLAYTYLLGTGKWVKEVSRVYELPGWLHAQAIKNKRRAFPFALIGMLGIGATAWLGAAADARGLDSLWHLGAASATLAFTLGAFMVEYAAIVAQARLLLEVKAQADRLREAQPVAASDLN